MSPATDRSVPLFDYGDMGDPDNITDWCLARFRDRYGSHVCKDDIWEYLYGVMHATDWRHQFRHDLQRNLPRIPLAADFDAFRSSGRELMTLHTGFADCPEMPLVCMVNGEPSEGQHPPDSYRIRGQMRWGQRDGQADTSVICINDECRLVGIPSECHEYLVSDRSPLEWAVASLKFRHDPSSGVDDDPNRWDAWNSEPFELIRHLRRLAHLSARSAQIIASMPPTLETRSARNGATC